MKEALTRLIRVKTIVTLIMTGVFAYLAIVGTLTGDQFLGIFTVVIAFYFGTQVNKKGGD